MVAQIDSAYIRTRPTRLWSRLLSYALFEGRPLTTKGRWINPAVFGLYRLLRVLPPLKTVRAPIFILGTGRSGTTILGIVLSMHSDIGFLNEPKALWASLLPDEDLIGSYNRNSARYRLTARDATSLQIRAAHKIFGGYLALTGTSRVLDKYPELIFRTEFVRAIFPDAKFLFLSRNGAETCGSIEHWSERLGTTVNGETHDWWGADDRKWALLTDQLVPEHPDLAAHIADLPSLDHQSRAAVEWVITMREGLRLSAVDPEGTLHVPYGALCADPAKTIARLEEFLGLRADATFRSYAAQTLSPPTRTSTLTLPDWLREIVDRTQSELDAAA